jgi:hypothetical protein
MNKHYTLNHMQQGLILLLALILIIGAVEPVPARDLANDIDSNPYIASMISWVDPDHVYSIMEKLTGVKAAVIGGIPYTISTRFTYSGEPIQKATQFVYEQLQSLGLEVEYHNWSHPSYPNVIGTIQGIGQPERIVMITAHLDDYPPTNPAPGADDNASGVAGVLAAAQVLSQFQWDCTLRFAAFTGEEQGMLGSKAYVSRSLGWNENIAGVLNLDMIGYNSDASPVVDLHTRPLVPGSLEIAETFVAVVEKYQIDLQPTILTNAPLGEYSDNKSFWDERIPAILVIENREDTTPYYHSLEDRLSTLDLTYLTNIIKASIGTLAHLGCLLPTDQENFLPLGPVTLRWEPALPLFDEEVVFTAAVNTGALPTNYTWDFGDGSPVQSGPGLSTIAHAFPSLPTSQAYRVSLSTSRGVSEAYAVEALTVMPLRYFLPSILVEETAQSFDVFIKSQYTIRQQALSSQVEFKGGIYGSSILPAGGPYWSKSRRDVRIE